MPVASARSAMDGVDARFVFKIKSEAGFADDHILSLRELEVLGTDDSATYFVLAEDGGRAFAAALERYGQGEDVEGGAGALKSLYNKIDSIAIYGPDDRRGPGVEDLPEVGLVTLDVTVWPSHDMSEALHRLALLELRVNELGGQIVAQSSIPRFTAARIKIDVAALTPLLALYIIESVRTPPVPFIDPSDWRGIEAETLSVEWSDSAPVGVLDDLPSSSHPLLEGHIRVHASPIALGRSWRAPGPHGTMVAGIALAPDIAGDLRAGPIVRVMGSVDAIRVLEPVDGNPEATQFPPEVLPASLVVDSIRRLHAQGNVRVFNLSFGFDRDYGASHVGEFSEMLDELARELNIVIVVAAGNISVPFDGVLASGHHVADDYPSHLHLREHQLAQPANAAIAVTVGGIAHSDAPAERNPPRLGDRAIAHVGHVSPFSRTGPGHGQLANRMNKPDFVAAAGNVIIDDTGFANIRDQGTGVLGPASRASGPLFRMGHGTSFATPAVSRAAAAVLHEYPDASANLVRALLASAAELPAGANDLDEKTRHARYGFGVVRLSEAVASRPQRVTMTYEGEMAVDTSVIHPIPIPRGFSLPRSSSRTIRIALAFDPPVRRTRREYTAATMVTDAYRNVDVDSLMERLSQQDPDNPQPLFGDRRRLQNFRPPHTAHRESTLQVKDWRPTVLEADDGDAYFVVLTHRTRTWFRDREDYRSQPYALTVTLLDEARTELDLAMAVTQTVTVRARNRARV
ncbi:S8 family peptidase [Microbacterium sp. CIAB417]|uniref:S8 family peptidase n=1 Tax=Microbacterium sp. CIAB417 TaxID=2860287 RepID=UPI001FADAE3D|nr:S8 family peptidase [Microbacterium sp. CIAB417]